MVRSARPAIAALTLALLTSTAPAHAAPSTTPEPAFTTDGQVRSIVRTPERTYIGGTFDYVGAPTGFGVALQSSGARNPSWPAVDGPVRASAADPTGGFFIGGDFRHVG